MVESKSVGIRTELIRLDEIAAGEWEAIWDGLTSSVKGCGALTGMPCWEREMRVSGCYI